MSTIRTQCKEHDTDFVLDEHRITAIRVDYPSGEDKVTKYSYRFKCPLGQEVILEEITPLQVWQLLDLGVGLEHIVMPALETVSGVLNLKESEAADIIIDLNQPNLSAEQFRAE